jgi:hypothetical protein
MQRACPLRRRGDAETEQFGAQLIVNSHESVELGARDWKLVLGATCPHEHWSEGRPPSSAAASLLHASRHHNLTAREDRFLGLCLAVPWRLSSFRPEAADAHLYARQTENVV